MTSAAPDPAAIRLEVLSRLASAREGWSRSEAGWRHGPFEVIPYASPGLSYGVWRGPRCMAAVMLPRDAIAVCECLASAELERPSSPERLFRSLSIPLPSTG